MCSKIEQYKIYNFFIFTDKFLIGWNVEYVDYVFILPIYKY